VECVRGVRSRYFRLVEDQATRTVEVDLALLAGARKAMDSRVDLPDAEVVEQALRLVVGRYAMATAQSMSQLTEDDAMRLAYEELAAMRRASRRVS
jgi:hypothetical protein